MAKSRPQRPPQVGDRVRAKTTRRTGTVDEVTTAESGHQQYRLSYDAAPQDQFLTTAGNKRAEVPAELLEPVTY